jgi:endonuclease/exonuclease/phosphatase family metal-dependent hydrolase
VDRGGTTLRLASVNAASGLDRGTWRISAERLGGAVARIGADVVAVQEVDHLLPRTGAVDQTAVIAAASAGAGAPWHHGFAAASTARRDTRRPSARRPRPSRASRPTASR